jgi:hypothetical protein
MQTMTDDNGNGLEPPHRNGAADSATATRSHAPWEFLILLLFVAMMAILIILGWLYFGSKSPERLPESEAARLSAACVDAKTALKALPNPSPVQGADRVARIDAENDVFDQLISRFRAVPIAKPTQADAVEAWSDDWDAVVNARDRYARNLEAAKGTDKTVKFVVPATRGLKPVTSTMDDFVRIQHPHIDACFTRGLDLELVEGERKYEKVTE